MPGKNLSLEHSDLHRWTPDCRRMGQFEEVTNELKVGAVEMAPCQMEARPVCEPHS